MFGWQKNLNWQLSCVGKEKNHLFSTPLKKGKVFIENLVKDGKLLSYLLVVFDYLISHIILISWYSVYMMHKSRNLNS